MRSVRLFRGRRTAPTVAPAGLTSGAADSGTLPAGEVIWDATADHLVEGDLVVPAGTRLRLEAGTWVIVDGLVNFFVRGEVVAAGTSTDPVVITSRTWSEPWGGMEFVGGAASVRYRTEDLSAIRGSKCASEASAMSSI